MISIIISTYQDKFIQQLLINIRDTIGKKIIYEIILIENHNLYSISEAYNIGASKAKYDCLLFIHEDILFNINDWGSILVDYLKNDSIGIIGVAGNDYLPNVPLGWSGLYECIQINLIQGNKEGDIIKNYILENDKNAISLDGVFLVCSKNTYSKYKFEEKIEGFHCYDFIFSNRVANDLQNIITSKIKITHFSTGNRTKDWMKSLIISRKHYNINQNNFNVKLELKAYYYYGLRLIDFELNTFVFFKEITKYLNFFKLKGLSIFVYLYLIFSFIKHKIYGKSK